MVWKWTEMEVDSIEKELCDNDIIIVKYLFHSTASEETGMLLNGGDDLWECGSSI